MNRLSSPPLASCSRWSTTRCLASTLPCPWLLATFTSDWKTPLMARGFGLRRVKLCFFLASNATSPGSPYLLNRVLSPRASSPQTFFNALEMADPPSPSSSEMYGGLMAFVASHTCSVISTYSATSNGNLTAGRRLSGSASIRMRMQLTSVPTILIRLCVPLTSTKHLVSRAYDALPPSAAQCPLSCGMYLAGSKVNGLSSRGRAADTRSSAVPTD